jgi:4-amino-4-deoxy-L-arabinose transferase-like glycosyltransferase
MSMSTKRWDVLLPALVLAGIVLAALPILTFPFSTDQGTFAIIGHSILHGGVPYLSAWDIKPPAIYYLYALAMALFGETTLAPKVLDLIVVPLTALGLYWLGIRLENRRVGIWAALIFAALYLRQTFWVLSQNDGFAVLPMILVAICTIKAGDAPPGSRQSIAWAFGAGAFSATVLLFKYPFALFIAAMVLVHVFRCRNLRTLILEGFSFTIGGLFVGGSVMLYMASVGALGELIQNVQLSAAYNSFGYASPGILNGLKLAFNSVFDPLNWGWILLLLARWPFPGTAERAHRPGWLAIWLWLAITTIIMLMQAKGWTYQWLPMAPPMALIAADSLDRLILTITHWLKPRVRAAQVIVPLIIVIGFLGAIGASTWRKAWPYIRGQQSEKEYFQKFTQGPVVASESLQVAQYVQQHSPPGSSLFIWGIRPEVYFLSHRDPPTRFIISALLEAYWYPRAWRTETLNKLQAVPSAYVLVLINDPHGEQTGYGDKDSYTLLETFPELNSWLRQNYIQETTIGNFLLWHRIESTELVQSGIGSR